MGQWKIHFFDTLESTNTTAQSYPTGHVIVAGQQQVGRGRCGRLWVSPKGGLYASFIFQKPKFPPYYLSFVLGISFLHLGQDDLMLKWPNDLFLNGAKCGGILLEQYDNTLIAGVGINLQTIPTCHVSYPVGCLNTSLSPLQVVKRVLPVIDKNLSLLMQQGFAPIRAKWLKKAYGLGEKIQMTLPTGDKISGIFTDITDTGALVLQSQNECKIITCGDMNVL